MDTQRNHRPPLFPPIGDSPPGEVVGGQFNHDLVPVQNSNKVLTHFPGNVGQYFVAVFHTHFEPCVGKAVYNDALDNNGIFLCFRPGVLIGFVIFFLFSTGRSSTTGPLSDSSSPCNRVSTAIPLRGRFKSISVPRAGDSWRGLPAPLLTAPQTVPWAGARPDPAGGAGGVPGPQNPRSTLKNNSLRHIATTRDGDKEPARKGRSQERRRIGGAPRNGVCKISSELSTPLAS